MTPNDNIPEENKPLPAEILKEIRRESFLSFPDKDQGPFRIGYQDGATAWARWKVKFDELQAENTILKQKNIQIESRLSVCEKEVYDHRKEYHLLQAQAQAMADVLGKISNIVSWMEETGANRISEIAETALKQWNLGKVEKKDQLIPTAIYKQQGSKTDANQFKDGKVANNVCSCSLQQLAAHGECYKCPGQHTRHEITNPTK